MAATDGEIVGELLCHLLRLPSGAGRELLLYSIGVRSGHRRRGAGRALVEEMLRWAEAERVPEVWVLADNPGAEGLYRSEGFEEIARRPRYYQPDDIDAIVMRLALQHSRSSHRDEPASDAAKETSA